MTDPTTPSVPTPASAPAGDSARALLKLLQERFSVFREMRPLAIGIDKQVLAALPDIDRKVLRTALRMHVGASRYLKVMEKASERFDLDGNAVAEVSAEHREHATATLKERFRKEAEQRRAKLAAEKEAQAVEQRAQKLEQLAARFAKR